MPNELGLFIMQSFMQMTYRRGRPNLLDVARNSSSGQFSNAHNSRRDRGRDLLNHAVARPSSLAGGEHGPRHLPSMPG